MLINEVSKTTNLTKKAIEYYTEQGLIAPVILENGYRDFSENDLECLKKISVFRKLGFSIESIRGVLQDTSGESLQKLSVQKELYLQKEQAKKALLDQLSSGKSYTEISLALDALQQNLNISEKLLESFPGYYGRFICLHFACFLNEPITTSKQQSAYQTIVNFLDNVPPLEFPDELQEFLEESTNHLTTESVHSMLENMKLSLEDIDKFMSDKKEFIEQYLTFKQSSEYKNSPAYLLQVLLKKFNTSSGYYDVFIPAMKNLSRSYADYYNQLEAANEKFLTQYPEINALNV